MTKVIRWLVVGLIGVHGLIHLLGAAKGLGWANVSQLKGSISTIEGLAWLAAAVVVLLAAVMIALGKPTWWWIVAVAAAVWSQVVITTAWSDAEAGTAVNVIIILAAVLGFAALGPTSPRAEWQDKAETALQATQVGSQVLTEADLTGLPEVLAEYIRRSGAVGKPRVSSFFADVRGRIRGGPDKGWMEFTGHQVNTYGDMPQRFLLLNASMFGLPIAMTHLFDESSASMRGKLLSLLTVVDGSGPDMERAETVTLFNDLVVMAPAAIPFASVTWTPVDDHTVRGSLVRGATTVAAELTFNDAFELTNFVSDDRLRASQDGKSFARMRWNTPITDYRQIFGRKVAVRGEGQWYAPEPEGHFTYIDFRIDDITYHVDSDRPERVSGSTGVARGRTRRDDAPTQGDLVLTPTQLHPGGPR